MHDFHEMRIIFTSKFGKNWIKSDASENNAFKTQFFSVLISQMGLSPLIQMKIVICCKEKNYKQQAKIRSMRAVFDLYLVPRKCQISEVSGASPGPPPGCSPGSAGRLTAPPDPQLGWAMTYGHCISCLRQYNHSIPH